jgi:hypothetical protein
MMTKDPKAGSGCETPTPADTLYYYDESVWSWCYYSGGSIGDEIEWKWYQPDGNLYMEGSLNSSYSGYACAWWSMYIKDYTPAYTSGNWRVDVYFEGILCLYQIRYQKDRILKK